MLIRRKRGDAYFQIKDYKNAIEDFSTVLASNSYYNSDPEIYEMRGTAYNFLGEKQKAETDIYSASEGYIHIGASLTDEGFYGQALEYLDKAARLTPENPRAFLARASLHFTWMDAEYFKQYQNGKKVASEFEQAGEDVNTAIKLDPNYAEAYYLRGLLESWIFENYNVFVDMGAGNEINADFRKVIELSNNPELRKKAQDEIDKFDILFKQRNPE